jgi:hypothetical protein
VLPPCLPEISQVLLTAVEQAGVPWGAVLVMLRTAAVWPRGRPRCPSREERPDISASRCTAARTGVSATPRVGGPSAAGKPGATNAHGSHRVFRPEHKRVNGRVNRRLIVRMPAATPWLPAGQGAHLSGFAREPPDNLHNGSSDQRIHHSPQRAMLPCAALVPLTPSARDGSADIPIMAILHDVEMVYLCVPHISAQILLSALTVLI